MEFLEQEKTSAFEDLCLEEKMDKTKLNEIIERYGYDQKAPTEVLVAGAITEDIDILERSTRISVATSKIIQYIEKFINGFEEFARY